MHARFYTNHLGRFMSVDPVLGNTGSGGSWNRYGYARGGVITYFDPNGLEPISYHVSQVALSREAALDIASGIAGPTDYHEIQGSAPPPEVSASILLSFFSNNPVGVPTQVNDAGDKDTIGGQNLKNKQNPDGSKLLPDCYSASFQPYYSINLSTVTIHRGLLPGMSEEDWGGITLGSDIYLAKDAYDQLESSALLVAHELTHSDQAGEFAGGVYSFAPRYLGASTRAWLRGMDAYVDNEYEAQAIGHAAMVLGEVGNPCP